MKKHFYFLLSLFLFINAQAFCQAKDSLLNIYKTESIYKYGNKYIKGDQKLSYKDLKVEFMSTKTTDLYKKSKRRLFVTRLFNAASLLLIVESITHKTNTSGAIKYAVATGVVGLGGIYYQTESTKFVEAALWERNKEVLFKRN